MRVLNWLNIHERISFKIAVLAYKSIHGLAPAYLSTYYIPVFSLPGRSISSSISGRVEIVCAKDKTCDARLLRIFLGLPQHLERSPCTASGLRTDFRQLQAKTEMSYFHILVIVLFFINNLSHRACLSNF